MPKPSRPDFPALAAARLELHHAIQLVAVGVGRSLLPPRDDDSHTTLTWHTAGRQWVGEPIPGHGGLRAGLRPADLLLTLGDDEAPAARSLALAPSTVDDAFTWLKEHLAAAGVDPRRLSRDAHYEIPPHPVADGGRFGTSEATARATVGSDFDLAARLLTAIAERAEGASPVRVWPHHFDIATLLAAGRGDDGGTRTIGAGMTPGDDAIAEPYWYVGPYPRPADTGHLPPLPHGRWETDRFFGAVFTVRESLAADGAAEAFLTGAVEAARRVWD